MKFNKAIWLSPLIFFEIYLSISIFLFKFGPWPWEVENPVLLYSYLLFAQLSILIGYLLSWPSLKKYALESHKKTKRELKDQIKFFNICIIINLILLIPTSLSRTGFFFPNIFDGISNPGLSYNLNYERLQNGNPFQLIEYIRLALSIFLVSFFPLAVTYWGLLTDRKKLITLLIIFFNLSMYIATGVNKGIADFFVTIPWLFALAINSGSLRFKMNFSKSIFFIGLLLIFTFFFIFGQIQREGGVGEFGIFNTGRNLIYAERDSGIQQYLPHIFLVGYESISRYLGQGYYALSLAIELNHSLTLGFGGSMFLARNADALFNTNFFTTQSLPALLEQEIGWGMFSLWHSIYPWLISDFGILGSLLAMTVFSYLLGKAWGESICTLDPLWIATFFIMLILFFYIPANNQVFQTGETTCCFILILLIFACKNIFAKTKVI